MPVGPKVQDTYVPTTFQNLSVDRTQTHTLKIPNKGKKKHLLQSVNVFGKREVVK